MSATILPFNESREKPDKSAFCLTPTAQDMIQLVEHVAAHPGWFGLIIGDPGVGKTTTLSHLKRSNDGIAYVVLAGTKTAPAPALKAVAEAVVAYYYPDRLSANGLFEAIKERLVYTSSPWRVILVDEAQAATDLTLEILRSMVDETGVPMVLAGNRSFPRKLDRNRSRDLFGPLLSRVLMRRDFSKPTTGDLKAVLGHWGIEDERIFDVIEQHVHSRRGGLRTAQIVVDWAQELAGPGNPVKCQHVKEAVKIHGGAS